MKIYKLCPFVTVGRTLRCVATEGFLQRICKSTNRVEIPLKLRRAIAATSPTVLCCM